MSGAAKRKRGTRRRQALDIVGLDVSRTSDVSMHRQIYSQIREMVLDGRLAGGTKLPSSRKLAEALDCSRMTTSTAYELLEAEGYIEGVIGSGTYVSNVLPDALLTRRVEAAASGRSSTPVMLSIRGARLAATAPGWASSTTAFAPGIPDSNEFPFDTWARLFTRYWRKPSPRLVERAEVAGYGPLREAIATYLRTARGLQCTADEVVITSGTTNALDIIARSLLDEGDAAWVEDPGYPDVTNTLEAAGARCVAVPVDEGGLRVAEGVARAPGAKLAWVTPSHQWPTGSVMSLTRRLELIEWAQAADAVVVEDDYDSEFRYVGSPLSSLQSLDDSGRVIYLGSFSKVCFPSMRLGYLVAPAPLAASLVRARMPLDFHTSYALQPVMAEFIAQGHYEAHIRRMRKRYHARQQALLKAAERHLAGLVDIQPSETGMSLIARFAPSLAGVSDVEVARRGQAHGLTLAPLSSFCIGPSPYPALVLGYGPVAEADIEPSIAKLADLLRPLRESH